MALAVSAASDIRTAPPIPVIEFDAVFRRALSDAKVNADTFKFQSAGLIVSEALQMLEITPEEGKAAEWKFAMGHALDNATKNTGILANFSKGRDKISVVIDSRNILDRSEPTSVVLSVTADDLTRTSVLRTISVYRYYDIQTRLFLERVVIYFSESQNTMSGPKDNPNANGEVHLYRSADGTTSIAFKAQRQPEKVLTAETLGMLQSTATETAIKEILSGEVNPFALIVSQY